MKDRVRERGLLERAENLERELSREKSTADQLRRELDRKKL